MRLRAVLVAVLAGAAVVGVPAAALPPRTLVDGSPATTERLDAPDAITSAVFVSAARFSTGEAQYAVLTRSDEVGDSLSAAPLSAVGPLLLTPPHGLLPLVRHELRRAVVPGATVYLLGGPTALGDVIARDLAADGFVPRRLAGGDRVATALVVADEVRRLFGDSGTILVSRAEGTAADPTAAWADSLTAGSWAAATRTPIVVTPTTELAPDVGAALQRWRPVRTVLLGGRGALSDAVLRAVPNGARIPGIHRADTAFRIAEQLWGPAATFVVVNAHARDGWAYALPVAGWAGDRRAPMIVTDGGSVPQPGIRRLGPGCETGPPGIETLVVGGRGLVNDAVIAQADSQDGGTCPRVPPVLEPDGLATIHFGEVTAAGVRARLLPFLGPPETDSGVRDGSRLGTCSLPRVRELRWGRLLVLVGYDATTKPEPDGGLFIGYAYARAFGPDGTDPRGPHIATAAGITVGSTLAELRRAYPNVQIRRDAALGDHWAVELPTGYLYGGLTATTDRGRVASIVGAPCRGAGSLPA